jgi:UDP-glucose 4-epimerase
MNRKIIVTGGCGYIGSHVARAFKKNGDSVFIIDRVQRDHTLKDIDGYFIDDFASDASLSTIYNMAPDIIVHCAGTSLVGPSIANPAEYYENNVVKTISLMNLVKEMPKKPDIMFSSSASVYGEPTTWPITEENELQPISPYGSTKLTDEMIFNDYGRAYGINTICFRYFNAAGAEPIEFDLGQEPNATHIVARVLEASLRGRAFTVNGSDYDTDDGTCIRDYIHVWDIATAHVRAAEYLDPRSGPQVGIVNKIFNLGTNKGVSNLEIVNYVNEKYKLPHVNFGQRRAGDPDVLVADATEARTTLRWKPEYSDINTIIDSAYKWYCSQQSQLNETN